MTSHVTEEQLITRFAILVEDYRRQGETQKDIAARIGISEQYLCDILRGRRMMGPKVLTWLGVERVVMYSAVRDDSILAARAAGWLSQEDKR